MIEKKLFTVACIPAFEEEATIAKVILSARKHVDKVLVCDDGSVDMTGEIAKECGAIVVRHEKNLGKGNSLKTLLGTAVKLDADVAVLIDGDGQHNPDEIPGLIEPILQSKADVVVGSRYLNGTAVEAPLYRRSGLRVLNFLHKKISKLSVTDAECGFRALSRKALSAVCFFEQGGYGADFEMLSLAKKNGLTVVEVPVAIKYKGLKKTSKKSPLIHGGELVGNLLRLVMEERPMLYLGLPGVVLLSLGMLAALYMVLDYNVSKMLSLHAMIVTMGSTVVGLLLVVTAFILYVLGRINNRITDFGNLRNSGNTDEQTE
jgi:glycosyltransferase involved in cell wall biosynthesis